MTREAEQSQTVTETERLRLRRFNLADAEFIHALVNQPEWLRHIGDRHVHDLDGARAYLCNGPLSMYARCGFGMYAVELKSVASTIGMCGLLKRDSLPDVDIGYALLTTHAGHGYALEAARACVDLARGQFKLSRLIAITLPDNARSAQLLLRLGMRFERLLPHGDPAEELCLYGMAL
jgi:RimJ/RimL family protein N-acetyltransferase